MITALIRPGAPRCRESRVRVTRDQVCRSCRPGVPDQTRGLRHLSRNAEAELGNAGDGAGQDGSGVRSARSALRACVQRAAAPQFPAVYGGPGDFPHGHVDDAAGALVAHVAADTLRTHAGAGGLRRADPDVSAGSVRGGVGGPAGPAQDSGRDAGPKCVAIPGAGVAGRLPAGSRSRRFSGWLRCRV